METKVFPDYNSLCNKITGEICDALRLNPSLLLCIAAGHTSLGVFEGLCKAYKKGTADFSSVAFVAMDEWLGMNKDTPGSCGKLLCGSFLDLVNFKPENVRLFDGTVSDPDTECAAVEEFIVSHSCSGKINYVVLGSGMNGHLALNEPGVSFDLRAHAGQISQTTKEVGQKYFKEFVELKGGLTLGIANFREADRSVLMISGRHKSDILKRIISENPGTDIPATAIKDFKNASLYYDDTVKI
ncbi:hypothetical protein FACS189485_04850 [Spirochaetia bacterium]|nr:hypothetical protein FACS189485_04850 [Spirochaetia bacterium]